MSESQGPHDRRKNFEVFQLEILDEEKGAIRVRSRAGEARAVLPEAGAGLFEPAPSGAVWEDPRDISRSRAARQAADFGKELFRNLFHSVKAGQLLATSLALAFARGADLRLVFHIHEAPRIAALPLERLCDPAGRHFYGLDPRTPMVRALPADGETRPVATETPVRCLVVAASPKDLPKIGAPAELEALQLELRQLLKKGLVKLDVKVGIGLEELSRLLRAERYSLLHFIGHGAWLEDGCLFLQAGGAQSEMVDRERLEVLLAPADSLRVVLLNCCSSAQGHETLDGFGLAQAISRLSVPAVVGMQTPLADRAAVRFAAGFYRSLAAGEAVDVAVNTGRQEIRLGNYGPEHWAAPVLFLRDPTSSAVFRLPLAPPPYFPPAAAGAWVADRLLDRPAGAAQWAARGLPAATLLMALAGLWFSGIFLYQLGDGRHVVRREARLLGAVSLIAGPIAADFWRGATRRLWRRGHPVAAAVATAAGVGLFAALWLKVLTTEEGARRRPAAARNGRR